MMRLSNPLPKESVKNIFTACANGYEDKGRRAVLMKCLPLIMKDSCGFTQKMMRRTASFNGSTLPSDVPTESLSKLYNEKFVPKKAPGRQYYDVILNQPKLGICPICGVRTVHTLDHYLPKSKYPTLSVTPLNLVPCCRDCNSDKQSYSFVSDEDAPLNPYFDDISSERWLTVTIRADQGIIYDVACPPSWSNHLKNRVKNHIKLYKLISLYATKAAQEINECIKLWQIIYWHSSDALKCYFSEMRDSAESNDLNSWRAALYRGLVEQFNVVELWM